jgi:hypothetical protein
MPRKKKTPSSQKPPGIRLPHDPRYAGEVRWINHPTDQFPHPVFQPDFQAELTPQEKAFLREQLRGGVLGKAFTISARNMPSVLVGGGVDDHYPNRCISRLNQLQGWVMHEAALLAVAVESPAPKPDITEEFPAAATVDTGWTSPVKNDSIRAKYTRKPKE